MHVEGHPGESPGSSVVDWIGLALHWTDTRAAVVKSRKSWVSVKIIILVVWY